MQPAREWLGSDIPEQAGTGQTGLARRRAWVEIPLRKSIEA
jgi:hypothetical protein